MKIGILELLSSRVDKIRDRLYMLQSMLKQLQTDAQFLAFHMGYTEVLPAFYAQAYTRQLGKYIELVPLSESRPILSIGYERYA